MLLAIIYLPFKYFMSRPHWPIVNTDVVNLAGEEIAGFSALSTSNAKSIVQAHQPILHVFSYYETIYVKCPM